MSKRTDIDYQKELEILKLEDDILGIVRNTINKLLYRHSKRFMSEVEKSVKRSSRKWKQIERHNDRAYVQTSIKRFFQRSKLEEGILFPTKDIARLVGHTHNSVCNALIKLRNEIDINVVGDYIFRPIPDKGYPSRIPILGKPLLEPDNWADEYLLLSCGGTYTYSLIDVGINPNNSSEIFKECLREYAATIRRKGYCWRGQGCKITCSRDSFTYIEPQMSDSVFDEFVRITKLPVGLLDDKPIIVYHPKLIRKFRRK